MKVAFDRPEDGWICLELGDERFHISSVTNFLGDLVEALRTFATYGEGRAVGQLEPGTCCLVFSDSPPSLSVELVFLNPSNKSVSVELTETNKRRLANTFLRALNLLKSSMDAKEFASAWGFYFPDLEPLADAVRKLK